MYLLNINRWGSDIARALSKTTHCSLETSSHTLYRCLKKFNLKTTVRFQELATCIRLPEIFSAQCSAELLSSKPYYIYCIVTGCTNCKNNFTNFRQLPTETHFFHPQTSCFYFSQKKPFLKKRDVLCCFTAKIFWNEIPYSVLKKRKSWHLLISDRWKSHSLSKRASTESLRLNRENKRLFEFRFLGLFFGAARLIWALHKPYFSAHNKSKSSGLLWPAALCSAKSNASKKTSRWLIWNASNSVPKLEFFTRSIVFPIKTL